MASTSLSVVTSLRSPLLNPKTRPFSLLSIPVSFRSVSFARSPTVQQQCPCRRTLRYLFSSRRNLGVGFATGESGKEGEIDDDWREDSSMPDRLKPLTKEAADRPVRWPWFIVIGVCIYAWRAVLWELSKWTKILLSAANFFLKPVIVRLKAPLSDITNTIEFSLYILRDILLIAPVPELTRVIFFSSLVLSIGGATVPDSVNNQKNLLSLSAIIGILAILGYINEISFWVCLSGLFCYSYFVKKRDAVSAALPPATALAAFGEPWLRLIVIGSYLALAIYQYSKYGDIKTEEGTNSSVIIKNPLPLKIAALSIGISLAAKWARHRHAMWMVA